MLHELGKDVLVNINLQRRRFGGEQLLCLAHQGCHVAVRDRRTSLCLQHQGRMQREVDLEFRTEVDHVGADHLVEGHPWVLELVCQGLEWVWSPNLLLCQEAAVDVGRELRRVADAHCVDRVIRLRADLPGCDHVAARRRLLVRHDAAAALDVGELNVAVFGEGAGSLAVRDGQSNECLGSRLDAVHEPHHWRLPVAVIDNVARPEIAEDAAKDTARVDEDERDRLG
mmetsp:Transcript_57736/g.162842  ORF Transcript_57736/g.162842 Transcript_57736/m.162842 type:complete len:227 (+) Transcript_57736:1377-2057(+)